jgi:hypothetical protein
MKRCRNFNLSNSGATLIISIFFIHFIQNIVSVIWYEHLSITAREFFKTFEGLKKELWDRELWVDSFYVAKGCRKKELAGSREI